MLSVYLFSLLRLISELFLFRFQCEKLILVGDPKQLPPTIQGSDAAHENGLEQTLFDRLCLMACTYKMLQVTAGCRLCGWMKDEEVAPDSCS